MTSFDIILVVAWLALIIVSVRGATFAFNPTFLEKALGWMGSAIFLLIVAPLAGIIPVYITARFSSLPSGWETLISSMDYVFGHAFLTVVLFLLGIIVMVIIELILLLIRGPINGWPPDDMDLNIITLSTALPMGFLWLLLSQQGYCLLPSLSDQVFAFLFGTTGPKSWILDKQLACLIVNQFDLRLSPIKISSAYTHLVSVINSLGINIQWSKSLTVVVMTVSFIVDAATIYAYFKRKRKS